MITAVTPMCWPCVAGVLHHGDLAAGADRRLHHRGAGEVPEAPLPGELPVAGLGAAAGGAGRGLHLPVLHAHLLGLHARLLRHRQRAQPRHHLRGPGAVHPAVHLRAGRAVSPCRQRRAGDALFTLRWAERRRGCQTKPFFFFPIVSDF